MKLIKPIVFFSLLFIAFTACKKDSSTPAKTIDGKWTGKFGSGNNVPSAFFSLNFKPGGVLEEIDQSGEVKGIGEWEIDNYNIITGYTVNTKAPVGNKYSIIAAFYPAEGKVLGNWGFGESATNGGSFEFTSKN